jgi:hypothetical protein
VLQPTIVNVPTGKVWLGRRASGEGTAGLAVPAGGGGASAGGAGGSVPSCKAGTTVFGGSNPGSTGRAGSGGAGGSAASSSNGFITGAGGGGGGGYYGGGGGESGAMTCQAGGCSNGSGGTRCNPGGCINGSGGAGAGSGSSFTSTRFLYPIGIEDPGAAQEELTPAVTVLDPASGARYRRGKHLVASYACDTRLAYSCKGTLPVGARIATSQLGSHTFKVTMIVSTGGNAGIQKPITVAIKYTVVK